MNQVTKKVRWVLAHEPIELFLRAAARFRGRMEVLAPGELECEVMTLSEYSQRYQNGARVTKHDLLDLMEEGQIEMAQMYTSTLGRKHNRDMWSLDMPFLFRDHEHAARVLEGPIGQHMMDNIQGNIQGLAFTYSGGYRMVPGSFVANKIEDFAGQAIRVNKSPIASETFLAIGANPVPIELEEIVGAMDNGTIAGGESTYPRFYGLEQNKVCNVINDSQHSLFLTSIIINKQFWGNMSDGLRDKVQSTAMDCARFERAESIEDIGLVKARCEQDNILVNPMAKVEQERFAAATRHLYPKFENMFSEGLLQKMQQS